MNINKKLAIIMVFLVVLFTSACTKTEKVTEPVNIHILLPLIDYRGNPNNQRFNQAYLDSAENYHKLNPQITVTFDYMTQEELNNQGMLKRIQSDGPPDIIQLMMGDEVTQIVEQDELLLDLQQLNWAKGVDMSDNLLYVAKTDGKLLLLPFTANPSVVLYNKDFFDAAHIPYPQGNWTWEQFREISMQIKPASGSGSALYYSPYTLDLLMGSFGISILSPKGDTSVGYLDSPEAISAINWLNAYYDDEGKTAPISIGDAFDQFYKNFKIGMVITDYNSIDNKSANMEVAPLPYFEGGNRANPTWFTGLGISAKSKHAQEAWNFIEYLLLTNHEKARELADYYVYTSKSMSEATGQNSDPYKSIALDEVNHATKALQFNQNFIGAWNDELTVQFEKLLTADSADIPSELHDIALKFDQELNKLRNEQQQEMSTF